MSVYIFGVLYNFFKEKYIFPLILIYPCLQLFNFIIPILEFFGLFDLLYLSNYKNDKELLFNKSNELEMSKSEIISNNKPI